MSTNLWKYNLSKRHKMKPKLWIALYLLKKWAIKKASHKRNIQAQIVSQINSINLIMKKRIVKTGLLKSHL